jgi:adenine-specific DNA-methyltransferase
LNGAKFRRQVWLGPFIADFFCADARLIVEVDGDSHADQAAYDDRRTKWLAAEGFRVVRVTNSDVMHNLDGVLEHIAAVLPSPSQS